jgi:hypothetical protein
VAGGISNDFADDECGVLRHESISSWPRAYCSEVFSSTLVTGAVTCRNWLPIFSAVFENRCSHVGRAQQRGRTGPGYHRKDVVGTRLPSIHNVINCVL